VKAAEAAPVLAEFSGAARRLERRGEAAGVEVWDDYGHHPAEIVATLEALRDGHRLLVLFQPHLYSRTRHLAHELAAALAQADVVAVADVYPAREEAVEGITGMLVVEALTEVRPGMLVAWTPSIEDGARFLAAHVRRGDRALTIGAGDVDRAAALLLEALG
jgi:UDP-N-acetylmuramate--alanine ligase